MELRLEFTVEPFVEGRPGPHVRAAIDEARRQGLRTEVGPFATTADGESERVLQGMTAIVAAAIEAGATHLALAVTRRAGEQSHPFLEAVAPVAAALDARVLPAGDVGPGDIPLIFEGEFLGGLRLPSAHGLLDRLIADVERELGSQLADLSREGKQQAVKSLNDRGAFSLRRSMDDVADALGVSRITVYNYLNAVTRGPFRDE